MAKAADGKAVDLEKIPKASKAGKAALQAFSTAANIAAFALIAKGIDLIANEVDNYIHRVEYAKEAIDSLESEYDNGASQLASMNAELETTTQRIGELENKGHLSFTEQTELDKLKEQNMELERNILLQNEKNKIIAEKAVSKYRAKQDALDSTFQSNINNYADTSQHVETAKQELDKAVAEGNTNDIKTLQENLAYYKESMANYKAKLLDNITDYEELKQDIINAYGEDQSTWDESTIQLYNDAKNITADAYKTLYEDSSAQYNQIVIEPIFSTKGLEDFDHKLSEYFLNGGQLDEESLRAAFGNTIINALKQAAEDAGIDLSYLLQQISSSAADTLNTFAPINKNANSRQDAEKNMSSLDKREYFQSLDADTQQLIINAEIPDEVKNGTLEDFQEFIASLQENATIKLGTLSFDQTWEGIGSSLQEELMELAANGELTSEKLQELANNNPALKQSLDSCSLSANQFADKVAELSIAASESKISTYNDVMEKMNRGQALSAEEMSSLIAGNQSLAGAVKQTADGYVVETDVLQNLLNQETQTYNSAIVHQISQTAETIKQTRARIKALANELEALETAAAAYNSSTSDSDRAWNAQQHYQKGKEYSKQQKKLNKQTKKLNKLQDKLDGLSTDGPTSPTTQSNPVKEDSKTAIDWVSRKLEILQKNIDDTKAKFENLFTLKKKENNFNKQIKQTTKLLNASKKAADKYKAKAKNVELSDDLKKKVRNGTYNINKYDSNTADAINLYKEYYDNYVEQTKRTKELKTSKRNLKEQKYQLYVDDAKAKIDSSNAIIEANSGNYAKQNDELKNQESYLKSSYSYQIKIAKLSKDKTKQTQLEAELQKELQDIEKKKFENIQKQFENKISNYTMQQEVLEAKNALLEAKGQKIQASAYLSDIQTEKGKLQTYQKEKELLEAQLQKITKGTDEWYEAKEAINKVDVAIINCSTSIAEANNNITKLADNIKGSMQEALATMAGEGDFLAGLMGNAELFDETSGAMTDEGRATLGMYLNGYNVSKASAQMDENLLKKLEAGKNHDFSKGAYTFIDDNNVQRSYNSLEQLQEAIKNTYESHREQIKNTYEYESKSIDMIRKQYEAELNAVKKQIDVKKNALQTEKSLHNYQKSIRQSTDNIDSLQKRIAAVQGDTSEEGAARLQKLQNELKLAQEDLSEKEYDHLIESQQQMLDSLYDEYSSLISSEMQDVEDLLEKSQEIVKASAASINETIAEYADKYGYTPEYQNQMNSNPQNITDEMRRQQTQATMEAALRDGSSSTSRAPKQEITPSEPKITKTETQNLYAFTTKELKNMKGKIEKIFDDEKYFCKGKKKKASDYSSKINQILFEKNDGKILTEAGLKALKNVFGKGIKTGDLPELLKAIPGNLKNVKGFRDGGIAHLVKSQGEDGIAMVRNGEGFVRPEDVPEIRKLLKSLPDLNTLVQPLVELPKLRLPDLPSSGSMGQVIEIGNITLPNVTNYDEFKTQMLRDMQQDAKFEKMVQSMTIGQITSSGSNRLGKNAIKF